MTNPYPDYFINNNSRRSILSHEEITDPLSKIGGALCEIEELAAAIGNRSVYDGDFADVSA
ncbi:hypothetical protein [Syntrophaceticus schinkii]|jgi:hypothetical protein|uniref:hypothetical protein n=1 Tax=Syntrophaceticus schinkii TaxID=499207 RepID=UPI0012EBB18D|nr:hypothetical protein [Syntrophaceticus schinkii]